MIERAREPRSAAGTRGAHAPAARLRTNALLQLQRAAGNSAVTAIVQRCGPTHPACNCADDETSVQLLPAAPAVQRQKIDVQTRAGVSVGGRFFSTDPAQLRTTLQILVVEKGPEQAESDAYAFLNMGMEDRLRLQLKGTDPKLIDEMQAALRPVLATFQEDRKKYVERFRDEAAAGTTAILTKTKKALQDEQTLYRGEDLSGNEPDLDGLRKASKALAAQRRTADKAAATAKQTFEKMRTQNQPPAHPGSFVPAPIVPYFPDPALRADAGKTNDAWFQEEQDYAKLRAQHEKTFPSLAMYANNEDGLAADRLEDLPTWGLFADRRMTAKILRELEVRIANNDTSLRDMEDKEKVWELPKIVDLTLKALAAMPHEQKWVKHRSAQIRAETEERKRLLMAITIGLAVAAGVLTMGAAAAPAAAVGTSVLAAAATTAQLGVTALSIAAAYQDLIEYRSKKAAQETSLDRAESLATDDPSFLWLAVTLVSAITEVSSLKATFTTLKGTIQAAKTARSTLGMAEEIARIPNLSPQVGESIVNRVAAEIDAMAPVAADPATLTTTAKLSSKELANQPALLEKEFQLAQASRNRRIIQNEVYAEEVILENGHVWRKQRKDGRWCRFSSDPLCFIMGEAGGGHIEQFPPLRKARQGEWSGTPGNSDFTPDNPIALVRANYRPIPYRNGFPVFKQFAEEEVLLPRNLYSVPDRNRHFAYADAQMARRRGWLLLNNEPDVARAEAFRRIGEFTWHHVEGDNILQLVPTPIHTAAQHAGGVAIPP